MIPAQGIAKGAAINIKIFNRAQKNISISYYSTEWTFLDESGTKRLLCLRSYASKDNMVLF